MRRFNFNWIRQAWKTSGSRTLGLIAGFVASYLHIAARDLDKVDASLVTEMIAVYVAAYLAVHRAMSAIMNPGDAARPKLADAEKHAVEDSGVVKVET